MGPAVRGNKAPRSGPSRTEITSAKPDKKPFDKKKWREGKYSNKLKGNKELIVTVTFKLSRIGGGYKRSEVVLSLVVRWYVHCDILIQIV